MEYEEDVAKVRIDDPTEKSIGSAAHAIVTAEAAKAPELKAAILTTDDPEAVHNLRVSIRRIRSAIRALGAYLAPAVAELDEPLHQLFEELGRVRDLDITCAAWEELRLSDASGNEVLMKLQAIRASSRLMLTVSLAKEGPLDELAHAVNSQPVGGSAAKKPSASVAPDLVRETYRAAHTAVRKLGKDSPPEDIHRVRRRIKRLRYTVEFFAKAYGKPAEKFVEHLKGLQDLLGEHQDSLLVAHTLSELSDLAEEAQRHVEQAVADLAARTHRLRRRILKTADEFEDKSWGGLKRRMESEAPS